MTIEKPETVTIDAGGADRHGHVVEPFAQILGATTIGEDCRIGACSIVQDSELGDGVEVFQFSIVGTSKVEPGAHIGRLCAAADGEASDSTHVANARARRSGRAALRRDDRRRTRE